MKRTLYIVSLLLASTTTMAANWITLDGKGLSSKDGLLGIQIDEDSLVRNGEQATVWMKMWWGTSGGSTQNYNSTYDCKQLTSNTNVAFQVGFDGKRYEMASRHEMQPVTPNTASEIVLKTVCSKKWFQIWKK